MACRKGVGLGCRWCGAWVRQPARRAGARVHDSERRAVALVCCRTNPRQSRTQSIDQRRPSALEDSPDALASALGGWVRKRCASLLGMLRAAGKIRSSLTRLCRGGRLFWRRELAVGGKTEPDAVRHREAKELMQRAELASVDYVVGVLAVSMHGQLRRSEIGPFQWSLWQDVWFDVGLQQFAEDQAPRTRHNSTRCLASYRCFRTAAVFATMRMHWPDSLTSAGKRLEWGDSENGDSPHQHCCQPATFEGERERESPA